jgi:hypothetical protein
MSQKFTKTSSGPITDIGAYACHPKLHGRLRLEGLWFQASWGKTVKKFVRPHLNVKNCMLVHTCYPREGRKHKIGRL